jgi:hypothetical protein
LILKETLNILKFVFSFILVSFSLSYGLQSWCFPFVSFSLFHFRCFVFVFVSFLFRSCFVFVSFLFRFVSFPFRFVFVVKLFIGQLVPQTTDASTSLILCQPNFTKKKKKKLFEPIKSSKRKSFRLKQWFKETCVNSLFLFS